MTSGSVAVSKWEKALSGTALAMMELVGPADVAPWLAVVATLGVSALIGGARVAADGV